MSASPIPRLIARDASTDAFISYSTKDQRIADSVVEALERAGIRCWIASRDLVPGVDWSTGIPPAIDACSLFILIFSEHANDSTQVAREVHIAQSGSAKNVIPFRIDAVSPGGALRYLLAGLHWLDATSDTRTAQLGKLVEHVRQMLQPADSCIELSERHSDDAVNNIPIESNTFVGREHEVDDLLRAIRERSVVSLIGTGGVGKTRLAVHCARQTLQAFSDGVWFIDLAPIVDGALVASTVAETLGITVSAKDNDGEWLARELSSKRLLLVLDNCEQVISACGDLVELVSHYSRDARILCTSRAPLGIADEFLIRLAPLPLPEVTDRAPTLDELNASPAIRLLLERARAVAPVSLPSPSTRLAVADIARQLDGLPLALELAAARTNVLSFEQISAALDHRFKLFTARKRGADPRQQTLSAMIDWSYDLLDEDERQLLRRLSVFRGGCTLQTATDVCADVEGDQWQTLDLLSSLTDKSLLVVTTDGASKRYGQLETIRDYSKNKLVDSGESEALNKRRTETFASIARAAYDEWDVGPRPVWLSLLSPELDNFRASLADLFDAGKGSSEGSSLAADLGPVFLRLSLLREGIDWCRRAAEISSNPHTAARANYVLSSLLYNRGEIPAAREAAEKAAILFGETGDERGRTRALSQVAQLSARLSYTAAARSAADEAVRLARTLGDDRLLASVLQRCTVIFDVTEIDSARAQFAECLQIFRTLGRDDETGRALMWWAHAEAEAECFVRARDLSMEALNSNAIGDSEMALKSNIAFFSLVLGDLAETSKRAREALELAVKQHSSLMIAILISYVAILMHERAPERGMRLLGFAESHLDKLSWRQTPSEVKIHEKLQEPLRCKVAADEALKLLAEGAIMSEEVAVAEALRFL